MSYHSYADDTQVYQVIKPQGDWSDLSERLERCLSDIADWMTANNTLSPVHEIRFKPQQSIFGNASGIFQTIEKYLMVNGVTYHSYAGDTQVYQVIKPQGDWSDLSERLERCLSDIADCMTANMPKRSLISSDCTDPIATL
jgi:hypothetical protein